MSNSTKTNIFRFWLWLIRLIGVMVPRRLRADWRQEWEAELEYREELLDQWDRLSWRNKLDLVRRSTSAFWDAIWMQTYRWEDAMIQDLRFGVRMLRKNPGFTLVAVITLALGIGANTAIFSVVNTVLLRPLPYHEPERLAQIWERTADGGNNVVSPDNFLDWQNQAKTFEGMSIYDVWLPAISRAGKTEQIVGISASANFFSLLGVTPQLGRTFAPNEEGEGQDRVVVITHSFWQNRLGGEADVIGKQLTLGQSNYTIVGVLGPDFRNLRLILDQQPVIFRPFDVRTVANQRAAHYLSAIGRINKGVSLEQAQAEMTAIARQLEDAYPETNRDWGVNLVGLHEEVTGSISPILLILQGTVALVLLIACVNVANLLLSRVVAREKEIAVRMALGAGRWRIIRLLLTEGVSLAIIGGAVGLLLAWWGVRLLVSLAPPDIPRLEDISIDHRALGFTFLVSLLTALLFGLLPALQATRANLNDALKQGSRSGFRRRRLISVLLVSEVALALVLLVGSGLLLNSLVRLLHVNPGFDTENLLTLRVGLTAPEARDQQQIVDFYQRCLTRIEILPEAKAAALTSSVPFAGSYSWSTNFKIEGQPAEPGREPSSGWRLISPAYFDTMGVHLRSGRAFNDRDTLRSIGVAIVNESFARRYFPNVDPIGRTIIPMWRPERPRQVVGVVSDFKHRGLAHDAGPEMYVPYTQQTWSSMAMVVRTNADPEKIQIAVQKAIWEVDQDAPISRTATMRQILGEQVSHSRFNTLLVGVFAVLALILAPIGIYGVMSYAVKQRGQEIGVRMALGAQNIDVMWLVVREAFKVTLLGIAIGLASAYGLRSLMTKMLFNVSPTDPLTFAGVALLLMSVALLACWIPARRATKVDPLVAVRHE
jgi:putative ABC transport system permease protein